VASRKEFRREQEIETSKYWNADEARNQKRFFLIPI